MFNPSRLYDLALSIGESLDLYENCEIFLKGLTATVDLTAASVWLRHDLLAGEGPEGSEDAEAAAVRVAGVPEVWFDSRRISLDHPVFDRLGEQPRLSAGADSELFADIKIERKIHRGVVGVMALGRLGFLQMVSTDRRGVFTEAELKELGRVVSKFTVSIEACLAHTRVMREVAMRKRVEIDLQHREEHFRALIENTLDIILLLDYDATIVFASPSINRVLGYRPEEIKGTNFFELIDPEEVTSHFQTFLARVKTPGEAPAVEMRVRHHDGSWRILSVSSNNLLSSPSVAGIIMNCYDVTERHEWMAQVEAARKRAVEASRAKSEFVANVSHEIRNPLNGVIGMVSMLLETDLGVEQRDYANTIRVSADTLLTVIEDILDLSKIESGRLTIVSEEFSLVESIEGCLDMVAPTAAEKGLELAYILEKPVPARLKGAGARFRQVLLNLLSNAVKFTERGEVLVTVSVKTADEGGLEISVSVRDTGIGIEPEGSERLFQPFVQADASTTRRYGGSGLGLAISKRLVELMGGRIWLESTPGEGSTFTFTVRAQAVDDPAIGAGSETLPPETRVIAVHTNEMMRDALSRYAAGLGLEMETTASISETLQRIREGTSLSVLIIDEAAFRTADRRDFEGLRDLENTTPIIAMRWASTGNGGRSREKPGFLVLNKPVKPSQLRSVIARAIDADSPGGGATAMFETEPDRESSLPELKILLAEDDEIGRKVAMTMLESLGCRVDVVVNGLEAVEAVEAGDYDVVLMDLQMPNLDGLQATRMIRGSEIERQPMIIALTARAAPEDRKLCIDAGMDGYLTKPVSKVELEKALSGGASREAGVGRVPPTLDRDRISVLLRTGGWGLISELIDLYLEEMPERIDLLREAIEGDDAETVRAIAHKTKGSSANLGLPGVTAAARSLEDLGRTGDLAEADAHLKSLIIAFERARVDLENLDREWGKP